ncbi:MAG: hypothetical protein AAFP87_20555 [Pseudomonadota bacterium]
MRFIKAVAAAAVVSVAATGATADGHTSGPKIYAYKSHANYCPAGLQPITISGVICCGVPNQSVSYQQMLAHPVAKKRHVIRRSARANCPVGTKGCTFD